MDADGRILNGEEGDISSLETYTESMARSLPKRSLEDSATASPQSNGMGEGWVSVEFETATPTVEDNVEVMVLPENQSQAQLDQGSNQATIMVAGRPRFGKSTALNNIFGLDFVVEARPTSVTQVVSAKQVNKEIRVSQRNGPDKIEKITLQVIDTPGLGALDIPKEEIVADMKKNVTSNKFTLLYCFSVAQNNIVSETDKAIIKNLHAALGSGIWSKCVILFTFSDYARTEFENAEEYQEYINGHAEQFEELLKASGCSTPPKVKTIFQSASAGDGKKNKLSSEIIAVPTRKTIRNSDIILPGILKNGEDWTDVVFVELMKKTSEHERGKFLAFKYSKVIIEVSSASVVTALAALVGVAVGGPVGGMIAALAGGATSATIAGIYNLVGTIRSKRT